MKRILSRRHFIRNSAIAAGGVVLGPNLVRAETLGGAGRDAASERINVAVIGAGGRGQHVMQAFMANPDVQVTAVCDVQGYRREQAKNAVDQNYGNKDCAAYIDMFDVLKRKDIDAVLIATGDSWHSGVSILAARAGKDMYCEKPMSVAINESRAVSDTMTRLGRIYQCGTQRRNISNFKFAVHLAQSGKLGELTELHAEEAPMFINIYDTVLPGEPQPSRDVIDWDRWLGPAPWRPYNSETPTRRFWGAHIDFAGGSITEWGSHTADLCNMAMQQDNTSPVEYWQEGDRWCGRYESGAKLVIRRGLRFGTCPVRFEGTEGWVETGDSGEIDAHPKSLLGGRLFEGGYPPDNHVREFLDCIKTREQPVANAETAHRSITACHLANICKRLGRPIKWDPKTETVIGDEEASRLTTRAYRQPWYL